MERAWGLISGLEKKAENYRMFIVFANVIYARSMSVHDSGKHARGRLHGVCEKWPILSSREGFNHI